MLGAGKPDEAKEAMFVAVGFVSQLGGMICKHVNHYCLFAAL